MGLEDVKDRLAAGGARWKVEDEVVVAFAEYLEAENDSWITEVRGQEKLGKCIAFPVIQFYKAVL
jgi:hypothetical protein